MSNVTFLIYGLRTVDLSFEISSGTRLGFGPSKELTFVAVATPEMTQLVVAVTARAAQGRLKTKSRAANKMGFDQATVKKTVERGDHTN